MACGVETRGAPRSPMRMALVCRNHKVVTVSCLIKRVLKMSIYLQTSSQRSGTDHKLLSTPNGTLFEILASREEVGNPIYLIRGTVPPGVAVPLHSHPDLEPRLVLCRKGKKHACASPSSRGASNLRSVGYLPRSDRRSLRNGIVATLIQSP